MKKMLWFPTLLLVLSIVPPTLAQDDQVILNPGTLSGSVSIAGYQITSITVYAIDTDKLYSAETSVAAPEATDSIDYTLTVEGDRDYYVMAEVRVSGDQYVRAFLPVTGPFNVSIGADVPVDISMTPATITGTISTGSSDNTIESYSIDAYISVPEFDDPPYYNYAYASYLNAPGDTGVQYTLLTAPNVECDVRAYINVDGLSYTFYDPDTMTSAAGGVVTRDYPVDVTAASISGTALLQGINVTAVRLHGYAYSPSRSNYSYIQDVESGAYTLNVDAGTWRLYPYFWFNLPGNLSHLEGYLRLPSSDEIEIQAGDQLTNVDFVGNPGFIPGRLNLWGANTDYSFAAVETQTSSTGGYSKSGVDPDTNQFLFVCSPDDWRIDYYQSLVFDYPDESDTSLRSSVYQRLYNSTNVQTVEAGQTTDDITLTYGTITVRRYFYVAGGGMLSSPTIEATRWESPYSEATGYGSSDLTDEGQAIVTLLLPGTYTIEAFAQVNGSTTEFGSVDVTVEEGDVVVIGGTDRPTTQITNPTDGQTVTTSTVTVEGTISDDSGIASITVNGQAVDFDPSENPVHFSCEVDLDPGENTITIEVCDVDGTDPVVLTLTVYRQTTGRSLTITSGNGGSVVTPGEGSFSYSSDQTVSIEAEPEQGYTFTGWTGTAVDAEKVGDAGSPETTVTVDAAYTLKAHFSNGQQRTLRLASTEGGSAKLSAEYAGEMLSWWAPQTLTFDSGTYISLEAIPEPGYEFTNWSGSFYSKNPSVSFPLEHDHRITANFVPSQGDDIVPHEWIEPVYRFWSPALAGHFYTIQPAERDKLIENYCDVWTYEGTAFCAFQTDIVPGTSPVYRFWSERLESHFYTIDETERDKLIKDYGATWIYEGAAFYAYAQGDQPKDTCPVYRFWSDALGGHFYTINETERDKLLQKYPKTWTYEGIAWYAYK